MSAALRASPKQSNLLRFLKPQTTTPNPSSLLRHLSAEPHHHPPPENDSSSLVGQVAEPLQTTDNDGNEDKFPELLFPSTGPPPSPRDLLQTIRRLGSTAEALKFFYRVQTVRPQESELLSFTLEAVFEHASREPNSHSKLLDLFKRFKNSGIPFSANAAGLLIRSFGRAQMVDESLLVYNELCPSHRFTHIRNSLIDLLFRRGRVDDGLHMLDEMLKPNAEFPPNSNTGHIVFNALLKRDRIGRAVDEEEVVGLVSKFSKHDVFPNSVWLAQLINRLCRKTGWTDRAWDILHELMKSGGVTEAASCNALLTALGKAREFEKMNTVMAEMKKMNIQPSVVTFGILVNNLCKVRRVDEALEVLEKMNGGENDGFSVEPDVIIYNTVIDGLCKVGRQDEGLGLLERMRSQPGCMPNTVTYNCLISGCCKSSEIKAALELFDEMNKNGVPPNVITLNTLVDGMCKHGRTASAVQFFREMQGKGLKGNAVTYASLINAFCNVNNTGKAIELFDEMLEARCSPDAIVYYTLISGLSRAGKLDLASSVVSRMKEAGFSPDIVTYNVLVNGFCRTNKLDKAYETLKEMEEAGCKPDGVTYNTLISYFSKSGDFRAVDKLTKEMAKEGIVPTVITYGALIHAYCLSEKLDEAMKMFREMSSSSKVPPNTVIYNILINSLIKKNQVDEALSLMDDMKVKEVKPNTNTFNAIFRGLKEKNQLSKAFELMDRMTEHACNPDYITMEILTEWLSAVGETKKLKSFVHGYQVSAPSGKWEK